MSAHPLTLRDIYLARRRIAGLVRRTPLVPSARLSKMSDGEVLLKLETLQDIGAFKLRGATSRLLGLDDDERRRGVVTVSTGNHGRAVAYAAARLGIRAVVCLSSLVPEAKVAAIRDLGAEVRVAGGTQDEAGEEALRLVRDERLVLVSPFDDPGVIAGQGTIGLELLEDAPDLNEVVVPLSGGGLIGGIALALKSASPAIRVVGVSMARGPAMYASLQAGRPVEVAEAATLADSLGGGIGLDNRWTFDLVRRHVDAAVGVAALLAGRAGGTGRRTVIVISGRNVDTAAFERVVGGG